MTTPGPVAVGDVFAGRFRLLRVIGEGEMGTTFVAEPAEGEACALKVLDAEVVTDDARRREFAERVLREARVESPHVVRAIDAGFDTATERPWIATELLDGEDLAARVAREPLKASEAQAMLAQLCDGLKAAHARGVVHPLLTPENVVLTARPRSGATFTVVLRELGLAGFLVELFATQQELLGTPIWMAPEQFTMGATLSAAANVWTLGLLGFYAFTGKPYWTHAGDDDGELKTSLREILVAPLGLASERAAALGRGRTLPPGFDGWFARCVVREAGARFADAAAAGDALRAMVEEGAGMTPGAARAGAAALNELPHFGPELSEDELEDVTTVIRRPASVRGPQPRATPVKAAPATAAPAAPAAAAPAAKPDKAKKAEKSAAEPEATKPPTRERPKSRGPAEGAPPPEPGTKKGGSSGGWVLAVVLVVAGVATLVWTTSTRPPPEPTLGTSPPPSRTTPVPEAGVGPDARAAADASARD